MHLRCAQPFFRIFCGTLLTAACIIRKMKDSNVQYRNMRYRIFRKKTYIMQEQAPISVADFNALAVRNCEGTEQLRYADRASAGLTGKHRIILEVRFYDCEDFSERKQKD